MIHDHTSTLRAILDAFAGGDVAAVAAFYDEDATVVQYLDPMEEHSGRRAIESLLRDFAEQATGAKFELINAVAEDDRLAAEVVMRGAPTGPSESMEVRYGVFMEFHDGKIQVERIYPVPPPPDL